MTRYKLTIEFDGTDFSGWQIQPDSRTVEETIEQAFSMILQQPVDIVGQGRTDAGVHARGQVAHVDLPSETDPVKVIYGVNGLVGKEIQIHQIEEVHSEFHARFYASSREYTYHMLNAPSPIKRKYAWWPRYELDIALLKQCAAMITGEHDFNGFSKFNEENYTTLCTVIDSEITVNLEGELIYRIRANRFLRNMVRRIVGTMTEVAAGRMEPGHFERILKYPDSDIPTFTAPARGLILNKVFYEKT
jgi:tRNA pseudouridine38-40 synthase